jgi:hypothetical protein
LQVFSTTLMLLDSILDHCARAGLRRPQVGPPLEPIVSLLMVKLGDGQARIRDAALLALTSLAISQAIGPG